MPIRTSLYPSLISFFMLASSSSCSDSALGEPVCPAGTVSVSGQCLAVCDDSCTEAGHCCVEGVCVPTDGPCGPPTIDAIDGTGVGDGAADHTAHHLRDRIILSGQNLMQASVTLAAGGTTHALEPCGTPADTQLELTLPVSLAAGSYTLSAVNQLGSCSASLQILQGEPGLQGPEGPAGNSAVMTAQDIVTTIEQAGLPLPGALVGEVTTLSLAASATTPSARSILIDGTEQVDDQVIGLYLAVLDLTTHQVYDTAAGGLSTRGGFAAVDAQARADLVTVLGALGPEHVVLLASAGDISAMAVDAALASALAGFGASTRFAELRGDESYLLVGSPGLGEGNGLEQVAGLDRAGLASLSTIAIDQAVLGLSHQRPALDGRFVNEGQTGAVDGSMLADGSVGSADVGFNYAASSSKGGPATDLSCSGCVSGSDIAVPLSVGALSANASGVAVTAGDLTVSSGQISVTSGGSSSVGISGNQVWTTNDQALYFNWGDGTGDVIIGGESETKHLYMNGVGNVINFRDSTGGSTSAYLSYGTDDHFYLTNGGGGIVMRVNPSTGFYFQTPTATNLARLYVIGAGQGTGWWLQGNLGANNPVHVENYQGAFRIVNSGYTQTNFQVRADGIVEGPYGTYHAPSDARLKKDVVTIPDALDKVMAMRGVNYRWKDPTIDGGKLQVGLVAQEVEAVVPEAVNVAKDAMQTKSVRYDVLVGVLIEAIKEQQAQILELRGQVAGLAASR